MRKAVLGFLVIISGMALPFVSKTLAAEEIRMKNRLAREKSPYLLQHADNPVDWYPWGTEAFEKARRESKPVFLSIGYSTCHWCHVMEEESFEKEAVAKVMNENFVSIKVDREERPDIDNIYMTAVQAMTGSGGWPLNIFLTPEGKPFFGGTYWPPEDRWGRPGLVTVLRFVAASWEKNRAAILEESENLTGMIQKAAGAGAHSTFVLGEETLRAAYEELRGMFDARSGGFGRGMKFPRSHLLSFLLRFEKRSGEKEALAMTEKTLQAMAAGGIWDPLGGGFHRYATDPHWFLPHFEKMLYDQALISKTYLEAYQLTKRKDYADTARAIFEYLFRDLRDSGGAFYSAEDADSLEPRQARKREGAFYVWEKREILEALGPEAGEIFSFVYGVEEAGNVQNDPQGEFPGKNVLSQVKSTDEAAKQFKKNPAEIEKILKGSRQKLLEIRSKRPRPHRDDKILTDWNGLVISSLALGAQVLGDPLYADRAREAADFILAHLMQEGRLLHRYREGEASIPGTIEDYAFFIHGLFDLYEATFETRYLDEAKRLTAEMVRLFWDESGGGFFFTASDSERLIVRQKEIYDGAIPSGNSVAALDLLRVGRLTMTKDFGAKADLLFSTFSEKIRQNGEAFPQMLMALDFLLGPSGEIVIAGDPAMPETQNLLREVRAHFLPNHVVALHPSDERKKNEIETLIPFIKNQVPLGGKPTAYVCQNYVCRFPASGPAELGKLLK